MRPTIRLMSWIFCSVMAGFVWAQDTTDTSDSQKTGTVYRCTAPDGSRWYKSKPMPEADCVVVGKYNPQATGTPNLAPMPGWNYLTSSPVADTYVQLSSIKRSGGSVGAWVLESYREPQMSKYTRAPFKSAMRRLSVKCDDRQVTVQKITFTAESSGLGEYVGEWRPLGTFGDFATPGSIDDAIAAYVCRSKQRD